MVCVCVWCVCVCGVCGVCACVCVCIKERMQTHRPSSLLSELIRWKDAMVHNVWREGLPTSLDERRVTLTHPHIVYHHSLTPSLGPLCPPHPHSFTSSYPHPSHSHLLSHPHTLTVYRHSLTPSLGPLCPPTPTPKHSHILPPSHLNTHTPSP